MTGRPLARRKFLRQAGVGGALAVAAGAVGPALARELLQQGVPASAASLIQLAEYAGVPLSPERAETLAPQLQSAVQAVRAMQPPDSMELEPAVAFRVPKGA